MDSQNCLELSVGVGVGEGKVGGLMSGVCAATKLEAHHKVAVHRPVGQRITDSKTKKIAADDLM